MVPMLLFLWWAKLNWLKKNPPSQALGRGMGHLFSSKSMRFCRPRTSGEMRDLEVRPGVSFPSAKAINNPFQLSRNTQESMFFHERVFLLDPSLKCSNLRFKSESEVWFVWVLSDRVNPFSIFHRIGHQGPHLARVCLGHRHGDFLRSLSSWMEEDPVGDINKHWSTVYNVDRITWLLVSVTDAPLLQECVWCLRFFLVIFFHPHMTSTRKKPTIPKWCGSSCNDT